MSLPNGFWPVVQTFGLDQYRTFTDADGVTQETWNPYFPNDDPSSGDWPVFIEGVVMSQSQVPPGMLSGVGDLLDLWPRTVYYGGPIPRYYALAYRTLFENWARANGWAYDTDVIPVTPDAVGMRHPSNNFTWYVGYETRPQKRYRFVRPYGGQYFHWVDCSFDTWKYKNFHAQNPSVT